MIGLRVIQPPLPGYFAAMTFPAYRHLLELRPAPRLRDDPRQRPIQPLGLAAFHGELAVGLALAELPLEGENVPELLSLFVAPEYRDNGIGTALVSAMSEEIAARRFSHLYATYMTGKPSIAAVERILAKCGFEPPVTRTVTVRFKVQDVAKFPWLDKYRVRSGGEIFPWTELKPEEREELQRSQAETGWIAKDLQPWDHDALGFEPVTSVGMRLEGKVVGWVINHAISETMLRFTCSYIRKDLGRRGRILPLYSESLRRLPQTQFEECTFVAPIWHPTMAHFVQRWVGPWSSFLAETRGCHKLLRPATGTGEPASEPQPRSVEGSPVGGAPANSKPTTSKG